MTTWDMVSLTQFVLLVAWTAYNLIQRRKLKKAFLVIMKTQYQNYILGVYTEGIKAGLAGAEEKKKFPKYQVDVRPIDLNKDYGRK